MTTPLPNTEVVTKASQHQMDEDGLPLTTHVFFRRAIPGCGTGCEDLAVTRGYGIFSPSPKVVCQADRVDRDLIFGLTCWGYGSNNLQRREQVLLSLKGVRQ